jgi:hypothetical protein
MEEREVDWRWFFTMVGGLYLLQCHNVSSALTRGCSAASWWQSQLLCCAGILLNVHKTPHHRNHTRKASGVVVGRSPSVIADSAGNLLLSRLNAAQPSGLPPFVFVLAGLFFGAAQGCRPTAFNRVGVYKPRLNFQCWRFLVGCVLYPVVKHRYITDICRHSETRDKNVAFALMLLLSYCFVSLIFEYESCCSQRTM